MTKSAFYFSAALIIVLGLEVTLSSSKSGMICKSIPSYFGQKKQVSSKYVIGASTPAKNKLNTTMEDCISFELYHPFLGDGWGAPCFKNTCDNGYMVYYQVIDQNKIIKNGKIFIKAQDEYSDGTIACTDDAYIKFIKKEIVR